ncbi:hypothetical protein D0Z67_09020 [Streptomyces seoulensis]|uniref:Uncharacterized protein n=1 Tax=Streptomyces seoulensis TaxID=73044 RepID=A0A4P6TSQ1_STRSO|nr:hypothetical protein D0Z67_09020 [Streptomyces seoulensis]
MRAPRPPARPAPPPRPPRSRPDRRCPGRPARRPGPARGWPRPPPRRSPMSMSAPSHAPALGRQEHVHATRRVALRFTAPAPSRLWGRALRGGRGSGVGGTGHTGGPR